MESADAHAVAQRVTGAAPNGAQLVSSFTDMVQAANQLVSLLGALEGSDGRAIWLTASEVELDQWAGQVVAFRDALAAKLQ